MCKWKLPIILQLLITITVHAQVNTEEIQLAIQSRQPEIHLQFGGQIKQFYHFNAYNYAWVNSPDKIQSLVNLLKKAEDLGLNVLEYQSDITQSLDNNHFIPNSHHDSLIVDVSLTNAAIHFFSDLAFGNHPEVAGYNGINYSGDCFNIPQLLASAVAGNRLSGLVKELEPQITGFQTLKDWLHVLIQSINDSTFTEVRITSIRTDNSNQPLIDRLYYLGIIDSLKGTFSGAYLKAKVRSAQRLFNLTADGLLLKNTLTALNKPIAQRITELKAAINTVRWIRCISMRWPVFVVNIPSANLLVVHKGSILLQSKVIVGKQSTPTPTLTSMITDVILYPYWTVPEKIASKELLPLIQRNPGYLAANNMQVLDKGRRLVNPNSINWKSLSSSWFPYTLRQSTGCDNSLGIVKLNFYSPYGVYLHDTPWKVLFNYNARYFSHGCMRVEKAIELAHFLLKENTIAIDTLEEKGCIRNQSPITIAVKEPVPVVVLYNTAWIDSAGLVQFNIDVYKKITLVK